MDLGGESLYANCVFADNTIATGLKGSDQYELDLRAGARISGSVINGLVLDPYPSVSGKDNLLNAAPPKFNQDFVPEAPDYKRPAIARSPLNLPAQCWTVSRETRHGDRAWLHEGIVLRVRMNSFPRLRLYPV
jgi:hypothetical protein